ncbi:C-type lectin mannose-binding isoform-like [Ylistrum balloti]|uniref:C-type lectin mannose-binding isoform-like n=1 Tax=Ylistrum balloti TaxID=509963 RepID=UPI002905BBAD|nr:C-type lectin mannose-binding isoform-like [Ylistrum balloti]
MALFVDNFCQLLQRCSAACPTTKDYYYKRDLNLCYHLAKQPRNITDAMLSCSVVGRLLRIDTPQKQAHIVEFLDSFSASPTYIGGQSENETDMFMYDDGTPLNFFSWHHGNPRGNKAITMKTDYNYAWNNVPGREIRRFLCEIPM